MDGVSENPRVNEIHRLGLDLPALSLVTFLIRPYGAHPFGAGFAVRASRVCEQRK